MNTQRLNDLNDLAAQPCRCGSGRLATLPGAFSGFDCPDCAPDEAAMARDPECLAKMRGSELLDAETVL